MLRGEHARRPAHGEDAAARGAARAGRSAARPTSRAPASGGWYARPSADLARHSKTFFVSTGRAPTAPPTSSCTTPRRPRTSPRRPFSPPYGRSIGSTAGGRSLLDPPDRGESLDRLRPRACASARGRHGLAPGVAASPEPAAGVSDELLDALAALGPDQRAVVVLRYLLGCTPGEIARALEIPRAGVNSRLRRALDALAGSLERDS